MDNPLEGGGALAYSSTSPSKLAPPVCAKKNLGHLMTYQGHCIRDSELGPELAGPAYSMWSPDTAGSLVRVLPHNWSRDPW